MWPIHLKPLDDELCSSWIGRLALAHGLHPYRFCSAILDKRDSVWRRDVDRGGDIRLFQVLATNTGIALDIARHTSLAAYEGTIFERIAQNNCQWILPVGSGQNARVQSYGQQYCPQCLSEDEIPYFRREWRLAFVTLCLKHGAVLFDRCPNCAGSTRCCVVKNSYRDIHAMQSLAECLACGYDLREPNGLPDRGEVLSEELAFQRSLSDTAKRGWIEIPDSGPVYSHLYFLALRGVILTGIGILSDGTLQQRIMWLAKRRWRLL